MKSFFQWASENKVELPVTTKVDGFEFSEVPDDKKRIAPTAENNKRTGYSALYPDGYVASQYPDLYWSSIKATAGLDKQNMSKNKKKK